jgi:hypothetical protein
VRGEKGGVLGDDQYSITYALHLGEAWKPVAHAMNEGCQMAPLGDLQGVDGERAAAALAVLPDLKPASATKPTAALSVLEQALSLATPAPAALLTARRAAEPGGGHRQMPEWAEGEPFADFVQRLTTEECVRWTRGFEALKRSATIMRFFTGRAAARLGGFSAQVRGSRARKFQPGGAACADTGANIMGLSDHEVEQCGLTQELLQQLMAEPMLTAGEVGSRYRRYLPPGAYVGVISGEDGQEFVYEGEWTVFKGTRGGISVLVGAPTLSLAGFVIDTVSDRCLFRPQLQHGNPRLVSSLTVNTRPRGEAALLSSLGDLPAGSTTYTVALEERQDVGPNPTADPDPPTLRGGGRRCAHSRARMHASAARAPRPGGTGGGTGGKLPV